MNRAFEVVPQTYPKPSSVPLERLTGEDEKLNLRSLTPSGFVNYVGLNYRSELVTDQGEDARGQQEFATKQLDGRINLNV